MPDKTARNDKAHQKPSYIGAPAVFALELACSGINDAFGDYGCYLVGSALERQDWRDVDIRFIMADDKFDELFPATATYRRAGNYLWEHDSRWLLLTNSISLWLQNVTGLPVDFQIQPQTQANERHKGPRNAMGMRIAKGDGNG